MREAIRPMKLQELELAMGWADKEGWNPGKYDHNAYYAQDSSGFLVLTLDDKPIASISVVKYSQQFAFIGLFIVIPEYRKMGYGRKLWDYAMDLIKGYANAGLYAVPQQVSRYQKSGFFGDQRNHRWQLDCSVRENLEHLEAKADNPGKVFQQMVGYDANLWGSSRSSFFSETFKQPQSSAFVSFNKLNAVNGYAVIRACMRGYRATVYSNTPEDAKQLTRLILSNVPAGSKVIFDIPAANKFSSMFAEFFGLAHVNAIDTQIMHTGGDFYKGDDRCYGVASLEIG